MSLPDSPGRSAVHDRDRMAVETPGGTRKFHADAREPERYAPAGVR